MRAAGSKWRSSRLFLGVFLATACCLISQPSLAQMAWGSYDGDETDDRAIQCTDFTPDLVLIKSAENQFTIARTSTMGGDQAKILGKDEVLLPDLIQSLDTSGFTIGTDDEVNKEGVTYHWIAFRATAGEMYLSSYTGNGLDNHSISGVGFQPDYLMILGELNKKAVQRFGDQTGDASFFIDDGGEEIDMIKAFEPDGFRVGIDDNVNEDTYTYHFVAWRNTTDRVLTGSYVGDDTDDRNFDAIGFQPTCLFIKQREGNEGIFRTQNVTGDLTLLFKNSDPIEDGIQTFRSNGFQMGRDKRVNGDFGSTYYYFAFRPEPTMDLVIQTTVDDGTPDLYQTITYTVTVTNTGPDIATGIELTDLLPTELDFLSATLSQGSYNEFSGLWTVGSLASDAMSTLTISAETARRSAGLTLTNTASLSAVDQLEASSCNDVDSVDVMVNFAAPETITANPTQDSFCEEAHPFDNFGLETRLKCKAKIGDNIHPLYQFDLSGITAGATIVSAHLEFTVHTKDDTGFPVNIHRVTDSWSEMSVNWDNSGNDYDAAVYGSFYTNLNDETLSVDIGPLVQEWVDGTYANNGLMFVATSDNKESEFYSREETTAAWRPTLYVNTLGDADLGASIAVDDATPGECAAVTYTITVTNGGPEDATNVVVSDLLPAGLNYVADTPSQGIYDDGTGVWTVGSIADASTATLDLTATVNDGTGGASITNTVNISSADQTDQVPGNNSDSVDIIPVTTYLISGTVFEDTDFAGIATDYDTGINDVGQPNVDVELYTSAGVYLVSTNTGAGGGYSFTCLAAASYLVRVRSATLGEADSPPDGGLNSSVPGTWPYPLPEMTWAADAMIGGQDADVDDTATADNAGPGDSWATVAVSGADVTGVNFGFSYEVIVNASDADDADAARSQQGSLRQFIKNSNAISGLNKSWFAFPMP